MMTNISKKTGYVLSIILVCITACAAVGCFFLIKAGIEKGAAAAADSFQKTKEQVTQEVYQEFYQMSFVAAEEEYHVSNSATIAIDDIKETTSLEVLAISDIVYITNDGDPDDQITSWLAVTGSGVFTVDLSAAEFIVDNARHYVVVRVPRPELNISTIAIDHKNVESLLFKDNKLDPNSSIQTGEALAKRQLSEAQAKIQQEMQSNQQYYHYAMSSAETMIKNLVYTLNPGIDDLQVEVEFY